MVVTKAIFNFAAFQILCQVPERLRNGIRNNIDHGRSSISLFATVTSHTLVTMRSWFRSGQCQSSHRFHFYFILHIHEVIVSECNCSTSLSWQSALVLTPLSAPPQFAAKLKHYNCTHICTWNACSTIISLHSKLIMKSSQKGEQKQERKRELHVGSYILHLLV